MTPLTPLCARHSFGNQINYHQFGTYKYALSYSCNWYSFSIVSVLIYIRVCVHNFSYACKDCVFCFLVPLSFHLGVHVY